MLFYKESWVVIKNRWFCILLLLIIHCLNHGYGAILHIVLVQAISCWTKMQQLQIVKHETLLVPTTIIKGKETTTQELMTVLITAD